MIDPSVMPDTWGTVEDSVQHLVEIGVQPMGELPRVLTPRYMITLPAALSQARQM